MRTLMDLQLDALQHMLERYDEDRDRSNLMSTLHRRAARKLEGYGQMLRWDSDQFQLKQQISHYLFLLRFEEDTPVKFWMPFSLVFKLDPTRGDVCDAHLKSSKPLFQSWDNCNACYLRYHKNELYHTIQLGLNNIVAVGHELADPLYRAYVLALQFVYCAEIMRTLICDINNPKARQLYLDTKKIALASLKELRNMPEIAPQPHANMLSNFYNFCVGPAADSRSIVPDPNQIQVNRHNAGM